MKTGHYVLSPRGTVSIFPLVSRLLMIRTLEVRFLESSPRAYSRREIAVTRKRGGYESSMTRTNFDWCELLRRSWAPNSATLSPSSNIVLVSACVSI